MNKIEEYAKNISPLVEQLKRMCFETGVPMFISCAVSDDGNETGYKTEMVSPAIMNISLADDKVSSFVGVLQGKILTSPQDMDEIEY